MRGFRGHHSQLAGKQSPPTDLILHEREVSMTLSRGDSDYLL